VVDDRQIVGDEEVGDAQLLLELLEGVDDLRLDGDVQRGDRLVADDKFRVYRKRPGNADALALSAGKLMGIAAGLLAGEPPGS
jgi:serine kinase of HPr protein (carbohydrate metabolism regulator)